MTYDPTTYLAGPLRWNASGTVLATWVLTRPLQISRDTDDAATNIVIARGLFEALAGCRYWIESLVCWMSPTALAEAMLAEGRDTNPRWLSAVDEAIDHFESSWLGQRRYLLTVELPTGLQDGLVRAGKAATNTILSTIDAPMLRPTADEYASAIDRMDKITALIPDEYGAVPATPEVIAWSRRHHIRRDGEDVADLLSTSDLHLMDAIEGAGRLEAAALDPNGRSTMAKRERIKAPWINKWVAVTDEDGQTNYQAHLVLRSLPRSLGYPSMEFLGRIDDAGVPIDYTITGVARPRPEAVDKNTRAMNKLNAQVDQLDGASAGAQNSHMARLRAAAEVLTGYSEDFTDDEHLVEHEPVIIASICAGDPKTLNSLVAEFIKHNRALAWTRPIGSEAQAFLARQPGGELVPELNAYRQVTHSVTMATTGAITSSRLGHDSGLPLWTDETSALHRLAFLEPWGKGDTFKQRAAAMATIGEQGAGKTYYAMTLAGMMVDTGARLVATDTTSEREWSIFADSLDTSVAKVDFEVPSRSVDPLRCLPIAEASEVTAPFLSTLLNLDSDAPERLALTEVLSPRFLAEHHVESLPDLLNKLPNSSQGGADALGDRLELWMDKDRFPALFDLSLPPVDTNDQCLIWGTYGLELPTQEELEKEHLFRKMADGKRMGRAIYTLFSWWSKSLCFRNPMEPAIQNIDEFHHILASPEATRGQIEFLRLMRHVLASVHYQTQLNEFPSEMAGLIGTRLVLRVDRSNLTSSADFLLDENASPEAREAMKTLIATHNARGRGAGILRVQRGAESQIGKVQTNPPFTEARRIAAGASSSRDTVGVNR